MNFDIHIPLVKLLNCTLRQNSYHINLRHFFIQQNAIQISNFKIQKLEYACILIFKVLSLKDSEPIVEN